MMDPRLTIGAGVKAKISKKWSARAEYLYLGYEDVAFEFQIGADTPAADAQLDAHVVRGGIAYHF